MREPGADLKTGTSIRKLDTPQTHNSTLIKEAMHNFSEKEALEAELGRSKEFDSKEYQVNNAFFASHDRHGINRRSIVSRLSKFEAGNCVEPMMVEPARHMKYQGQQTSKLGRSGRDDTSSMYVTTVLSTRRNTTQKPANRGKQSKETQNASVGKPGGALMPIIESHG